MTVPLLGLSVRETLVRCEKYFRRFWLCESRVVTITY